MLPYNPTELNNIYCTRHHWSFFHLNAEEINWIGSPGGGMHGSELKLVASGRILLTNGLVSVRTLVLSLLYLFVSSAFFLYSTWWLLTADYPLCLILLLYLYTLLFFRLFCTPSPSVSLVGLVALFSCISPIIGLPILVLTFGMVPGFCFLDIYIVSWWLCTWFWIGLLICSQPDCSPALNLLLTLLWTVNGLGFGSMTRI